MRWIAQSSLQLFAHQLCVSEEVGPLAITAHNIIMQQTQASILANAKVESLTAKHLPV
jgi:hypothetical protein